MARFDTVTTIITDVSVETGLGVPTGSVESASGDPNIYRMFKLLKSVGRSLVIKHPWLQQLVQYSFETTTETVYSLPADFQSMVDQTGWNRTTMFPMTPANSQEWQCMLAQPSAAYLSVVFRSGLLDTTDLSLADSPTIELITTPEAGQAIAFEYRSRYWVRSGAMPHARIEAPLIGDDYVLIESGLITRALKLAWLRALGFDSTAAQQDFEEELAATKFANVGAAPILSLSSNSRQEKLISESSAPGTGFGFDSGGLFP